MNRKICIEFLAPSLTNQYLIGIQEIVTKMNRSRMIFVIDIIIICDDIAEAVVVLTFIMHKQHEIGHSILSMPHPTLLVWPVVHSVQPCRWVQQHHCSITLLQPHLPL